MDYKTIFIFVSVIFAGILGYTIASEQIPYLVINLSTTTEIEIPMITPSIGKYFYDEYELRSWLDKVSRSDDFTSQSIGKQNYDCEDWAVWLKNRAMQDGYCIDIQYDKEELHALCTATSITGNRIWFIEPQWLLIKDTWYCDI